MSVRAIRGAIQVESNTVASIHAGVKELLTAICENNALTPLEVISVILTSTPDLTADFPAAAAREIGFGAVPLLCAAEIDVPGALARVIRVMVHCESDKNADQISHIYLKGAVALRKDLAQ
ncbi:MAG: chorismate mutase [Actinomycetota bacterium]